MTAIMHVNPFFFPYRGGTENYVLELSRHLVKQGHEVSVVCADMGNEKPREEIDGISVYRVPARVFKNLPSFLPPPFAIPLGFKDQLERIVALEQPSVIHLHNRFFTGFDWPAVSVARKNNARLFLTLHNSANEH